MAADDWRLKKLQSHSKDINLGTSSLSLHTLIFIIPFSWLYPVSRLLFSIPENSISPSAPRWLRSAKGPLWWLFYWLIVEALQIEIMVKRLRLESVVPEKSRKEFDCSKSSRTLFCPEPESNKLNKGSVLLIPQERSP